MTEGRRTQFTFYESFFLAIRRLKDDKMKAALYDAICAYALYGEEPELEDIPAAMFDLIRPNLDASRKKAANGRKGGRSRTREAGKNQEPEGCDGPGGPENDAGDMPPAPEPSHAGEDQGLPERQVEPGNGVCDGNEEGRCEREGREAVADYLNRINPEASPRSLTELRGFAAEMGAAVCKRAFDIALDEKKTGWAYIRAILKNKRELGVKSLADWEALEKRKGGEQHGTTGRQIPKLQSETDGLFEP